MNFLTMSVAHAFSVYKIPNCVDAILSLPLAVRTPRLCEASIALSNDSFAYLSRRDSQYVLSLDKVIGYAEPCSRRYTLTCETYLCAI